MVSLLAARKPEDLADVAGLVREGRLRPVIDRCYTLGEVPEALRYVGQGHARGKVAITV
jgi:NADPH:quinone reductase-like Zn-dependent oxidoreductase